MSSCAQPDLQAITAPAAQVEQYLADFLDHRPLPVNLRDAMAYGVLGGGKRLRPVLAVRCCEAAGGRATQAMPAAAAMELVHCFSLVHDDLPAMDDDDMRRGRPTLHRHTNEAMAILAGDGMLSLAMELLVTRVGQAEVAVALVRELSVATTDMIAGQVYDTLPHFDPETPEAERLETIHRNKTAALLRASCRMGAICAGGSAAVPSAVTRYAEAIGLMFQIVDDLLDVTATAEQMGKATGKDADKGKLTYPGLIGVQASRQEVSRLQQQAHEALADLGPAAQPLRDLCDYMAVRDR